MSKEIIKQLNKELTHFKNVNCELCGTNDSWPVYKDDMGIPDNKVWCKNCGLIYKNKIWTESDNNKFYNKYYLPIYHQWEGDGTNEQKFFDHSFQRGKQVDKIKELLLSASKPIEIGCGTGGVLAHLTKYNKASMGIDINKGAIEFAKKKGLNAKYADLFKLNDKFDLVWSSHMFEHLLDFKPFLKKFEEITTKDAKVILIVPNSEKMGEPPHSPHIFNFYMKTFVQMIESKSSLRLVRKISSVAPERRNWDLFLQFEKNPSKPMTYPTLSTSHSDYMKHMRKLDNRRIWSLRERYDNSTSKKELKEIKEEYNKLGNKIKPIQLWLFWSKLYRLFTNKKINKG